MMLRFAATVSCLFVLLSSREAVGQSHRGTDGDLARPNVLLIVSDDQRPDTIAALGNKIIRTPNLDALVRRGTAFTRAVAPDPVCTPSRAEIISGASGFRNGVTSSGGRFKPELVLWGQTMREAGYHSWYVGKWMNDGRPTTRGYEESLGLFCGGGMRWWRDTVDCHGRPVTGYRGWVFQTDAGKLLPERGVGLTPEIDKQFADAAIEFLRRKTDRPFFLHVNFTAPHDPLLMPPGCEGMYDPKTMPLAPNFLPRHPLDHGNLVGRDEQLLPMPRTPDDVRRDLAVYYAVISHMDRQIGRILAALRETGQAENTLVLFTSDQGLAIGSHGLRGKQNMYDHTVGTPLIVAGPGIPHGQCRAQCYLRDLYPTVCELTGIAVPKTVEGRSLAPLLKGEAESIYPAVFGCWEDTQRMIRTERFKLIVYPKIGRCQLFDLERDPDERNDLSQCAAYRDVLDDLSDRLAAWQRESGDPAAAGR